MQHFCNASGISLLVLLCLLKLCLKDLFSLLNLAMSFAISFKCNYVGISDVSVQNNSGTILSSESFLSQNLTLYFAKLYVNYMSDIIVV